MASAPSQCSAAFEADSRLDRQIVFGRIRSVQRVTARHFASLMKASCLYNCINATKFARKGLRLPLNSPLFRLNMTTQIVTPEKPVTSKQFCDHFQISLRTLANWRDKKS